MTTAAIKTASAPEHPVAGSKSVKRRRPALFWFMYFAIVTLAACALIEGSVRLLGLAPPLVQQYNDYVRDEFLPHKPRPLSVIAGISASGEYSFEYHHNSQGFRDVEHTRAKPDGTFRIVGLGSSYTYGAGASFDETALSIVERQLNSRVGHAGEGGQRTVEVIRMGIPNFTPEAQRMALEHYGLEYQPDLILIDFLPAQVIDTFRGTRAMAVSKLGYLTSREAARLGETATWLFVHSHVARIALKKYVDRLAAAGEHAHWEDVYRADGYHEKDWREVERQFERIARLATLRDVPVAVVYIPPPGPWDEKHEYPPARLRDWCAQNGVEFINTLPAMRVAAAEGTHLYWPKDGHCTPEGYRLIGETVARALIEAGLF